MSRVIYIVAEDREAFERWCWKQDPNGELPRVKYVANVATLGWEEKDVEFLFLKGWQKRPDWRSIYDRALAIGRRAR